MASVRIKRLASVMQHAQKNVACGVTRLNDAASTPPPPAATHLYKINHLRYPSSVMNCLYVAFDVSSAYRYPNASRKASNF